jgi:hypothetical protein
MTITVGSYRKLIEPTQDPIIAGGRAIAEIRQLITLS